MTWEALRRYARTNPTQGWIVAWLTLVAAICTVRFSVIDSPPYYDFATGLFLEANFLAESNFDYAQLASEESRWMEGGSAVYVTSVMPTLLAGMMKVLPTNRSVLVAYHVFNFGCASAVALLMVAILRLYVGWLGGICGAAMLLTAPLFSTQIDMLGMDLPMAACGLATVWCVQKDWYFRAGLFGLATSLVKTPGRAVASAVLIYLAVLVLLSSGQPRSLQRRIWGGLGWLLLVVAIQDATSNWLAGLPHSEVENWSSARALFGGNNMLAQTPRWFPDQIMIFAAALLGSIFAGLVLMWKATRSHLRTNSYRRLFEDWRRLSPFIIGWIASAGLLVALYLVYCLPRYFLLMLPFVYLSWTALLFCRPSWRRWSACLAAGIVLFNVVNAYGRFYPAIPEAGRTGAILERSRECLWDHRSNIAAVQRLVREEAGIPILCAVPFVHFLSLPRLGYVEQPLRGYSMNTFTTPTFASATKLPADCPRELLVVSVDNPFSKNWVPTPQAGEPVVYNDHQSSPLVVYRRRWPTEMSTAELRRHYEEMVLPSKGHLARANQLAQSGDYAAAITAYRQALALSPYDAEAHFGLAFALLRVGSSQEAAVEAELALRYEEKHVSAQILLGAALAEQRRFDEAVVALNEAVQLAPSDPAGWSTLGRVYLALERWREAKSAFGRALAIAPQNLAWLRLQAYAMANAGDVASAAAVYKQALALATSQGQTNLAAEIASQLAALSEMHPGPVGDASLTPQGHAK